MIFAGTPTYGPIHPRGEGDSTPVGHHQEVAGEVEVQQPLTVRPLCGEDDCLVGTLAAVPARHLQQQEFHWDEAAKPAGFFILGFLIALIIFEVWALRTHHNTWSHLWQRLSRAYRWFMALSLVAFISLTWHLIWGFPSHTGVRWLNWLRRR